MDERNVGQALGAKYQEKAVFDTPSIRNTIEKEQGHMPMRMNLRDRIVDRSLQAQLRANENARLQRLAVLADKNPEVLEIIDILQGLNLL